ncbi:MaoC/PaaZ C-terminal domain-containing protein [Zoogloeaceae bacterium G21618-S1]|nr:MaoC/PaaZ C-terminal domain-containing protein [Zoogloeaceae bacterium G21618-S1]
MTTLTETRHAPRVLGFGADLVRAWATFSSDFNPVHFDTFHAREAGLDGVIVHGMLALLPIKQAMAEVATEHGLPPSEWSGFRAVFRKSIPLDAPCRLSIGEGRQGMDFRLKSETHGDEHFRGSLFATVAPTASIGPCRSLDDHAMLEQREALAQIWPGINAHWVLLDAIIFADFLRSHLAVVQQEALTRMGCNPCAPARIAMFQTSHSVTYHARLADPATPAPRNLSYVVPEEKNMIANGHQVMGTVPMHVSDHHGPVMQIDVGLMAKLLT